MMDVYAGPEFGIVKSVPDDLFSSIPYIYPPMEGPGWDCLDSPRHMAAQSVTVYRVAAVQAIAKARLVGLFGGLL